ncbi:hypothetical protein [Paenibacillus harenae]|uniref:hypothetical protein n=1 Tax=Paenibacillus harenae TaxID=306543 RepID=UPI0027922939|nr:hypothetical protein [Paenibacillus harenae]MDQ0062018.1 uncharacterized protein affecting Mg2+/Co2+ transport [Paenibacillus harenae]
MNTRWIKIGAATVATYALLAQSAIPLAPLKVVEIAEAASITSQSVKLNATSTISVHDGQFLMQEQGKVFAYTVTIKNSGNTTINLQDYYIRLVTKSGSRYISKVTEADKTKATVAPNTTVNITYYAVVNINTKLSDLAFNIIKWDFSTSNYERLLGKLSFPEGSTDKVAAFKAKAMLFNSGTVRGALKQYMVTSDKNNVYVTMSFLLENSGLQSVNVANMKLFAQSEGLATYNVDTTSLANLTIQPKERKIVTLSSTLPLAMKGKKFALIVASPNEGGTTSSIPIGVFDMPKVTPAAAVEIGKVKTVYLNGVTVNSSVGFVTTSENDDSSLKIEMDYDLENIGASFTNVPNLNFSLVTASGVVYPLAYSNEGTALSLLPKIKKTITMSGDIPASVNLNTSQLVVRSGVTETNTGYVVASYKVNKDGGVATGGSTYSYDDGYQVKLNTIHRLPTSEKDTLMAEITITNTSKAAKKTPNLSGYFLLNGVQISEDHQVSTLDSELYIEPNAMVTKYVHVKIPYTSQINNVSFVLTELPATTTDKAKKLYQFGAQTITTIPTQTKDQSYTINNAGSKADIKLLTTRFYDNTTDTYFYSEFAVTNKEQRYAAIANISGYLQDVTGFTIPVEFVKFSERVTPDGTVLISAWAKVSKNFNRLGSSLIIGKTVDTSVGEVKSSVILKPVAYKLTDESGSAVKTDLLDITFGGYKLTLTNLSTQLAYSGEGDSDGIQFDLDYDLEIGDDYDFVAGEHKIVIELNGGSGNTTYSKTFGLKKSDDNTLTVLEEGKNNQLSVVFNDANILNKINNLDTYTVNIYDVFEGAKMLIATKKVKWFTTT